MNHSIDECPLSDLRETYAPLRLISPKAETAMARSLERYGQVSPVICLPTAEGPEMLDGFKRLRAARHLVWPSIRVTCLVTTIRAGKAGMIQMNRISRSITDIEEALILHSLHRDDGLNQAQIAALLGQKKNWVSRRLSLVERLHEEIWPHLERGSISIGVGRELAKLPRGLQVPFLTKILKDRLGRRDVGKVVRHLLAKPSWHGPLMVQNIWEILSPDVPTPASSRRAWFRRLADLHRQQHLILAGAVEDTLPESRKDEWLLQDAINSGRDVLALLNDQLRDDPLTCGSPAVSVSDKTLVEEVF